MVARSAFLTAAMVLAAGCGATSANEAGIRGSATGGVSGSESPKGCASVAGTPSGATVSPRGTYCHWDLSSSPNFAAGLADAVRQIAWQASGCTFRLPAATSSDWSCARVAYMLRDNVLRRLGPATNGVCTDGWRISAVDGNQLPTELELCTDSCAAIKSDPVATLEVSFGCNLL